MPAKETMLHRGSKVEFPFHFSPSKKLLHIVVRLTDVPGSLDKVLRLLGTRVNLIGTTSYTTGEGAAIFSGFAESALASDTAQLVQDLLVTSPNVLACKVWESHSGLLVDWFHTGLRSGTGEAYVMLPASGVSEAFEKLVRMFGSGGATILYSLGMSFGANRFKAIEPFLGPQASNRATEASQILETMGYGSTSMILGNPGELLRLRLNECFECSAPSKSGRSCGFVRGFAVGYFGALFRVKVDCEEIRCRQRGKKFCEFVITRHAE